MSKELNNKLNDAIAREMGVSIQYMWQHVTAEGMQSPPVATLLREIAIVEMRHAEIIAERLNLLGGTPTTQPTPIKVGKTLVGMLKEDVVAEQEAIKLYREIIKLAQEEEDYTTRRLFEEILADEEGHLDSFKSFLKK